ncbi:ran GTPase activating protein [Halictus rubicundus]|uniref:ran GTPase activating protein n=1 Tax=Halictus rubicundus TaxID=77578 RepID=UPI0040358386
MTPFNLSELESQLENVTTNSTGTGVSFAKKSLKLDSEADAVDVVNAIRECPKLEFLDLEGNTLGPLAAKAVAKILEEKGSCLKRALWKDMFTGRLKSEIPKAIEYLGSSLCSAGTRLIELDLSDNAFGPIGVQGLASFLTSNTCYTLRELRLNNNGLGISGGNMLAKALSDCYENSCKTGAPLALKVFVAGRNRLENEGAKALALVFQKLTSLEEVVMPQNGIYHAGIAALATGLSANPGLKILNLNDNTVGVKGARALAKALPNFKNLEQLNLGDCLIKTQGCLILAEALGIEGNHPLLNEINFTSNEIRTEAANSIAVAMADKECLTSLQLDGNLFGSEGRTILRELLTISKRINSLGSFDEDETDDEEDEDNEDQEENTDSASEENEDNEEEEEEEEEEDAVENGNTIPNNVTASTVTVTQFLKSPTYDKLLLLSKEEIVQHFIDQAKKVSENADTYSELMFIEELTSTIMKVSSLCSCGYVDVRMKALVITNSLYSKLFSFAKENDQTSILNNALLVNLGLIKSENKQSGKIDWDLEGCFKALETIIHKDYFLDDTRNTLKLFLDKPIQNKKKVVDSCQEAKDSLLRALNGVTNT